MVRLAMSKGVVVCRPVGSYLGNSTLSYLHARAHAERVGAEFQCNAWIGERIFDVPVNRETPNTFKTFKSTELAADATNVNIHCYAINQKAMIYTKRQAQAWLKFRPEVAEWCERYFADKAGLIGGHWAHWRRMDFEPLGFPLISRASYYRAHAHFGVDAELHFTSWEEPMKAEWIPDDLFMLLDFYALCKASLLFRANSTFSWLAGLLSDGRVFSPVIDGMAGGENDVHFIEGNWPSIAPWHECCTDQHVAP